MSPPASRGRTGRRSPGSKLARGTARCRSTRGTSSTSGCLIIARHNSAFETAENLMETDHADPRRRASSIRMAWRTHTSGTCGGQQQLPRHVPAEVGQRDPRRACGGSSATAPDSGSRSPSPGWDEWSRSCSTTGCWPAPVRLRRVHLRRHLPPSWSSGTVSPAPDLRLGVVNVPGLYFAGTLSQQRDFKKSTSGFIHGFRYGVRALHKILERRTRTTPCRPRSWTAPRRRSPTRSSPGSTDLRPVQQFGVLPTW